MWSGARPEAIEWNHAPCRSTMARATKTLSVLRREK
jgi:hypothetical protein